LLVNKNLIKEVEIFIEGFLAPSLCMKTLLLTDKSMKFAGTEVCRFSPCKLLIKVLPVTVTVIIRYCIKTAKHVVKHTLTIQQPHHCCF